MCGHGYDHEKRCFFSVLTALSRTRRTSGAGGSHQGGSSTAAQVPPAASCANHGVSPNPISHITSLASCHHPALHNSTWCLRCSTRGACLIILSFSLHLVEYNIFLTDHNKRLQSINLYCFHCIYPN